MKAVAMFRLIVGLERLKLGLDFLHRPLVEQLSKVGRAEYFLELRLVDGECLHAPFRERRIAVVDVVCDVREQQC